MADKIYRVVKSDVTEMNEKIYKHRKKILSWIAFVTIALLLTLTGYYLYIQSRVYTDYDVVHTAERQDSAAMQFISFQGNILKYGKDGASCIDSNNKVIWNQAYEMQEPMADICQGYAVVADEKGKQVYIMNKDGPCGQIETTMPIQRVQVANQGTVAILMEQDGIGYLQIYDKGGAFLAEGELHTKNSGYPLDIAISNDGKKMAVSLLDVNEGNVKTTIVFYDFTSTGQKEIDNIVGRFSYADMVFPQVEFLTNDSMAAFGSGGAEIFEDRETPQVGNKISIEREIRSIFYNDMYLGFVYANENKEAPYMMQVFDLEGKEVFTKDFNVEYQEIGFLENGEICVRGESEGAIFTLRGREKFHGNFQKNIKKVLSAGGIRNYIFLGEGETQRVRLK